MMTISIGFMQVSMWSATADIVDRCTSVRSQQSIPASIFVFWGEQTSTYSLRGIRRGNVLFLWFMYRDLGLVSKVRHVVSSQVITGSQHVDLGHHAVSLWTTVVSFKTFRSPTRRIFHVYRCLQFRDSYCPLTLCTQLPKTALVALTCIRQP